MNQTEFSQAFPLTNFFSTKEKIRIKFFNGMVSTNLYNHNIWINPVSWVLKCYYDLHGFFKDRLHWCDPQINDQGLTTEDFIKIIEDESVDVVCFSIFSWNHERYLDLAKTLKEKKPQIVLFAGGPDLYVHKDNSLWQHYSCFDAIIYGDGEEAFVNLIDTMIDPTVVQTPASNIIFLRNNVHVDCGYKRFNNLEHNFISPYLHNSQNITDVINCLKQVPNNHIILNWEFTRGCPYQCSFCDWSSGLHHKVTRKQYDYSKDLTFFSSLDISVNWIDANIGIFNDDIKIVETALSLMKENKKFNFNTGNFSKLKKNVVYEIIAKIAEQNISQLHCIGLQDINPAVLKNISRPEIPWTEHKQLITDIKKKHPSLQLEFELIIGLPGQTIDSYTETLLELTSLGFPVISYTFNLLPNSPAFTDEYLNKHNLKPMRMGFLHSCNQNVRTLHDLKENLHQTYWTKSLTVESTMDASFSDIITMLAMSYYQNNLIKLHPKIKDDSVYELFKTLVKSSKWKKFGEEQANLIKENSSIFGFPIILINHETKVYPFSHFFKDERDWS